MPPNDTDTESTFGAYISRVAMKIPPFMKDDVELWFNVLESQFQLSNISQEDTKYNYVVANLTNPDAINAVREFITNKPNNPYTTIKERLIKAFKESEDEKIQKLLNDLQLGDKKPTAFLREMRGLAENRVTDQFLKPIFFKHLPTNIQQILEAMPSANLTDAAEAADKMLRHSTVNVNAIQNTNDNPILNLVQNLAKEVAELKKENQPNTSTDPITELTREIKEMKLSISEIRESRSRERSHNSYRGRSHSHSRSRSRPRHYDREQEYKRYPICWYHYKFGKDSHKCSKPCNFEIEKNQ